MAGVMGVADVMGVVGTMFPVLRGGDARERG